mmetsp:Transcript_126787/g.405390  ORF Transcript_126787/g.405390 Transcript_126787/m.405390 type:complete len:812 (-) Transcript_126787:517-2952(-)
MLPVTAPVPLAAPRLFYVSLVLCAVMARPIAAFDGFQLQLEERWPAMAGRAALTADVSPACNEGIKKYLLCKVVSGVFSVCANDQLLNSSESLRFALGCTGMDLEECKRQCIRDAETLTNESINSPCTADFQAMQGFGAQLDIFTMGQLSAEGVPQASLLPLPNIKNMGGATLIKYGEPSHCAEIPSAEYCVIQGTLAQGAQAFSFALGNCLPKVCSEDELRSILETTVPQGLNALVQCDLVRPLGAAEGASKSIQNLLGWGGIPVYYPNKIKFTVGAALTLTLVLVLAALMTAGTWLEWRRESKSRRLEALRDVQANASGVYGAGMEAAVPLTLEINQQDLPPPSALEGFVNHWSLLRNGRSFMRVRKGDKNPFAVIDFLKTFSMGQVILGHSYFYIMSSAGFANMEQFNPPNGLLGQFWFQAIPGCFYGVDSFFVISGFLCAIGLDTKLFNDARNRTPAGFSVKYLQFVVFRWLRLVPTEMFCIALSTTLLPYLGTGVLWNMDRSDGTRCYEANGSAGCGQYWWTNLLFIQDADKYMGKCYGHTWYLANDFQLYMTAPFFGIVYSISRKAGWIFIGLGMLAGVLIPVILTAQNDWVPEIIAGSSKGFDTKFYMKPWCRCPAFFIGIALGWAWPSVLERYKGRHQTCMGRLNSYLWAILGFGLCGLSTFGRMAFFQCTLTDCFSTATTPVSKFWQYVWVAFSIPGWCLGVSIILVLCSQNRFIPLLQNIFTMSLWQPIAKLSYSAYLIHTSILVINFCQLNDPIEYSPSRMFFNFVAFVVTSLFAAFWIYMFVEKPVANLQMKLLGGGVE